jgi:hypothetical protein
VYNKFGTSLVDSPVLAFPNQYASLAYLLNSAIRKGLAGKGLAGQD